MLSKCREKVFQYFKNFYIRYVLWGDSKLKNNNKPHVVTLLLKYRKNYHNI